MKLILLGSPGAGKGTLSKDLAPLYGLNYFATGDMLREVANQDSDIGRKIKEIIFAGNFVSDELIIEMLASKLDELPSEAGILFDGFPRTKEQAEWLDEYFLGRKAKIDAAILLVADHDVLIKRIAGRRTCKSCRRTYNVYFMPPPQDEICECGELLTKRADDTPETVTKRLEIYELQSKSLIDYYKSKGNLIEVDANGEHDEVLKRVVDEIERRYS